MELQEIYIKAKENGLCQEWQDRMKSNLSLKNLCEMYFDGDDWAMEKDFPNVEVLRKFKGSTEKFGLFTDYVGMPNILPKMAFFGDSVVQLNYNGYSVSQLVFRHNSKAKINVTENAIVIINLLDLAELEIEAFENSRVEVFTYGNDKIKYSGDVRITKTSFK